MDKRDKQDSNQSSVKSSQLSWHHRFPDHSMMSDPGRGIARAYYSSPNGMDQLSQNLNIESDKMSRKCDVPSKRIFRIVMIVTVILVIIAVIATIVVASLLVPEPTVQYVRAKMTARVTNLEYSAQLADSKSDEFIKLQSDFCSQVGYVVDNDASTPDYKGCRLEKAQNGSVIVVVMFYFDVTGSTTVAVRKAVLEIFKPPGSSAPTIKVATFIISTNSVSIAVGVIDKTATEQPVVLPDSEPRSTSSPYLLSSKAGIDLSSFSMTGVDASTSMSLTSIAAADTTHSVPAVVTTNSVPVLDASSSLPAEDATTSIPVVDATSSVPVVVATSSIPAVYPSRSTSAVDAATSLYVVDSTISIPFVDPTTSIPPVDATTSIPVLDATTSIPAVDATISLPAVDATTSIPVPDKTTTIPAVDATTPIPAVDATASVPVVNATTSIRVVDVTTSIPAGDATTSIPVLDATTSIHAVDATTSVPVVNATTSIPAVDATTSIPVVDATTSVPVVNATTSIPAVDATTSIPVVDATTSVPVVNATTSIPAVDATTSIPVVDATTSVPVVNATTSIPAVDATTSIPVVDATTSVPVVNATTSIPAVDATTSIPVVDATTSVPVVNATTSIRVVDVTTSIPAGDATTSVPVVNATTSIRVVDVTTSIPAGDATTSIPVLDATTSIHAVDAATSIPILDATTSIPAVDATTLIPFVDATTSIPVVDAEISISAGDASSSIPVVDVTTSIPFVDATTSIPAMDATTSIPGVLVSSMNGVDAYSMPIVDGTIFTSGSEATVTFDSSSSTSSLQIASSSLEPLITLYDVDSSESGAFLENTRSISASIMDSTYFNDMSRTTVNSFQTTGVVETSPSSLITQSLASSFIEPTSTLEIFSSSIPTTPQPPVVLSMDDVTAYEKENVSLLCKIEGNYTMNTVQFLKDGEPLTGTPNVNSDKTVFTYTIPESTCTDTGQYECVVTGEEGNFTDMAEVSVQVQSGEPTLTVPFEIVEGRWKETSLFVCKYKQGIPKAQVYWSASLANGTTIDRLNLQRNDFVEETQTDACALEATSQFFYAFSMEYNASSICCNVKQGENVSSACDDIYVVESSMCINRTGYREHPYSCQFWIECTDDRLYMNRCPEGSCINIDTIQCGAVTHPTDKPSEDPFSCKGRANSYIPRRTTYPDYCATYQRCVNDRPSEGTCQGGTYLAADTSSSLCTFTFADSYCGQRKAEEASSSIVASETIFPSSSMPTPSITGDISEISTTLTIPKSSIDPTSTAAFLSSSVSPTLTRPPTVLIMENVTVHEGVDVILLCSIEGNFTLDTVQFYKEGKLLSGTPVISNDETEFRFTISDTQCSDSGEYRCMVTGEEGNLTDTAQVVVQALPEVMTLTLPFEIIEDKPNAQALYKCTYKLGFPVEAYWTGTLANGTVIDQPGFTNVENIVAENQTDECSLEATSQFYHGFSMDWNASRICCNVRQGDHVSAVCEEVYVVPADICQGKTYYEHPYSCKVWIECVGTTIYMRSCSDGECYVIESGTCQQDLSTGPKGEFSCEGRASGVTIARENTFPNQCKEYYFCANGKRNNRTCPDGTYLLVERETATCGFDYKDSYCAQKAGVNASEGTTGINGTEETTDSLPALKAKVAPSLCDCGTYEYIPTEYTYPNNCTKYYRCVNGMKLERTCASSLEVNYRIAEESVTCVRPNSGNTYCQKVTDGEMESCGSN